MPVVDASVVVDWVAPSAAEAPAAVHFLDRLVGDSAPILAPRLILEEVSNALLTGIRRGRWTGPEADRAQVLLHELPVELADTPRDLERAWHLSRRYDDHPIYDMLYVALAERRETLFVSADAALRRRLVGLDWVVGPEHGSS